MRLISMHRPTIDDSSPRKPNSNDANAEPPPGQGKRPLSTPAPAPRSLSGIGTLQIGPPRESSDVDMQDVSEGQAAEKPRKRAAIGDGISAGSASPFRDSSTSPPPPRRSKARPVSSG